jgi:hypothetical protein
VRFDQPDDATTPPSDAAAWSAFLDAAPCDVWAAAYPEADSERVWQERAAHGTSARHRPLERTEHSATPFDACPAELRQRPQWVLWRYNRKGTKIPLRADSNAASTTNPKTWTTFERACRAYRAAPHRFAGIGYVFTDDDPYVGIDLDNVLADGEIVVPDAAPIVAALDSYTEISPSGTGLKLWVRGSIERAVKEKQAGGWGIEIYARSRFFTVTGQRWGCTPATIRPAHDDLARLVARVRPADVALPVARGPRVPLLVGDPRTLRYAEAALRGEQQRVLDAPEGQRHNTRFSAACRVGRFAAVLGEQRIFDALFVNVGPDKRSAARAIWDGIKRGKRTPGTLPAPRPVANAQRGHHTDRWWEALPPDDAMPPGVLPDEAAAVADPRDALIARLQCALAAVQAERDHLRHWRDRTEAIIAKPTAEMRATDKLTAIALASEMDERARQGITELHPIYIGGACATTGVSAATFGASLRRLAEMGVIEREQTYERDEQKTYILIRPLRFDAPDTWTPVPRIPGASRRDRTLPAPPMCPACGPDAPCSVRDTTYTEYRCDGCGNMVGEFERVGQWRLHPQSRDATTGDHRPVITVEPEDNRTPTPDADDELAFDPTEALLHRCPSPRQQDAVATHGWAARIRQIVRVGRRGARRRPP